MTELTFPTSRLEAFSDGVFAIAITLLILDVKTDGDGTLFERLLNAWPHYVAYFMSFLVIGAMWMNHHYLLTTIHAVGRSTLIANLGLLGVVAFLPFPTALLATHITQRTHDATTAACLYALNGLLISMLFFVFASTLSATTKHEDHHHTMARFQQRALVAPIANVIAFVVAFWEPALSFALFALLSIYFVISKPPTTAKQQTQRQRR